VPAAECSGGSELQLVFCCTSPNSALGYRRLWPGEIHPIEKALTKVQAGGAKSIHQAVLIFKIASYFEPIHPCMKKLDRYFDISPKESIMRRMFFLLTVITLSLALWASAEDGQGTRLLTMPAIARDQIAFVYAGDLWIADQEGNNVRRLTTREVVESRPAFSPDGKQIAFSAKYDGNVDVYVMPLTGGTPTRLTWHPGVDTVQSFTPDGTGILFTSPRLVHTGRYTQLFVVPVKGGFPEALPIPFAHAAVYSPDGTRLAYNPLSPAFNQWKHYRGGTVSTISIYRSSDHSLEKIAQPAGRANDAGPIWIGDSIYFRSDRNGEFNLFSYQLKTKTLKQLTRHSDFPVLNASGGDGKIIYEQAGVLHIFDPKSEKTKSLAIQLTADLPETRTRFVKGTRYIRNASLSPTGSRAVFEFRGEIITVPAEKGDPRNLTNTPGCNERSPVWSPDGKQIAYFSDEPGEYTLYVRNQDGKGDPKKYPLEGAGFYENPLWSPDCKKIVFSDNSWSVYWIDLESGKVKKISSEILYGPARARAIQFNWSPDSKWIAYTQTGRTYIQSIYVYSIESGQSARLTDGLSDAGEPVFDASGKYLYFLASTDAGPVKQWFDMSNADMRVTRAIYLAVLRKDLPSPLAKESDEEKGIQKEEKRTDKEKGKEEIKPEEKFSLDLEGITQRILALPVPSAQLSNLQAGSTGEIFYLERNGAGSAGSPGEVRTLLRRYDINKRKEEVVLNEVSDYDVSADGKKILMVSKGNWSILPATGKTEAGQGKLNLDAIEVRIEPRSEWNQIFQEAWRINRDYFYDPNMHGANWKAMREKYAVFLPWLSTRSDLNRVLQWMCSELVVGHHRVGGGEELDESKTVPVGLLGANYAIENGRYRFSKIFGGLNWNPELRSPLTEPGSEVKAGEYLLAVRGRELKPPMNLYSLFENSAGKIVEITVGPNPDGTGSRAIQVVPVADEVALRNRDWVEGNLKKVEAATGGRVAYVYVPNTSTLGHTYFKRYFFPQVDKEAIIVDERHNGGGQVADYYIDFLRRPLVSYWATRYGEDIRTPGATIPGPKVMLIDETAGSGGDLLPWMFRKFKLGQLIGKRTWGGLVGILGFPVLMDGGFITAPNLAIWTEEGWVVENEGVPPDIEVEQTPAEIIAGHDPQLEKAIQVVMEELKKNPPKMPKRPPFPIRVK
jgi:tricorn protease